MRVGYTYLHTAKSGPPDWFLQEMDDYLGNFLPAYYQNYLHASVSIEPSPPVIGLQGRWDDYLLETWQGAAPGFDSLIVMTDAPFHAVDPDCGCAGLNLYQVRPNFAWASVMNWDAVDEVAARDYSTLPALDARRYAFMYGRPANPGIRGLAVAGHEITHYVLLEAYGMGVSSSIDGGALSGLTFFDHAINPVQMPGFEPPNWPWVAQRVTTRLPFQSDMGAYGNPDALVPSMVR
jgi:hypothetical protein